MYHCQIQFYLFGRQGSIFQVIKEKNPLEHFSHEFFETDALEEEAISKADVILASLQGVDAKAHLDAFLTYKKEGANLILLADKDQRALLDLQKLSEVTDIWSLPLTEEELAFHFLRWQQNYKQDRDFWQTRSFLDATINSVPHLIWYKDKSGAHEKVNESFCRAVNKTMEQIEGRGHYYIWDIEPDEYAKGEYICMESEFEVMNKRETCIFDEKVKIGEDMRLLKTYKSPLFDIDGSVIGTVGVAMDVTQERLDKAYDAEEHFRDISASIGTAHSARGELFMDALIGEADAFMYRVKNGKKGLA